MSCSKCMYNSIHTISLELSCIEYMIFQLKSQLSRFLDFFASQLSHLKIKYTGNTRACIAPKDQGSSMPRVRVVISPERRWKKPGARDRGTCFAPRGVRAIDRDSIIEIDILPWRGGLPRRPSRSSSSSRTCTRTHARTKDAQHTCPPSRSWRARDD